MKPALVASRIGIALLFCAALIGVVSLLRAGAKTTGAFSPVRANSTQGMFPANAKGFPGHAPRIGKIEIGAFAPEAAARIGLTSLSLPSLDNDDAYAQYRAAIHAAYGADLADMNYLAVGIPGWEARDTAFRNWLFRAAVYGPPTIAIEPLGKSGYGAFRDTPEMEYLRSVFGEADRAGIVVWVRFASEANLRLSDYSVYNDPVKIRQYRQAVQWFRASMPRNVRLVFSPLINTAYLCAPRQLETLRQMYVPGDYDRIGGTLYATTKLQLTPAYTWYHAFMRRLDPISPFQICELGGIYTHRADVEGFLRALAHGAWPDVERVNLFAGDLNAIAVSEHGHFGFLEPGASISYVAAFFGAAPQRPERSEELTLGGTVMQVDPGSKRLILLVTQVTDTLGETFTLSPPRRKRVLYGPETQFSDSRESRMPTVHETVQITGWDTGTGTPFHATQILNQ